MDDSPWHQVNLHYPGQTAQERETHATAHLGRVLPATEAAGLITTWWFIRKGAWRVRYLLAEHQHETRPARDLLADATSWTHDIYEPETHAFGGPDAMAAAHTLFHHDSRHVLPYLHQRPTDRQERSLVLCAALLRAAGLDLNEQGDVWAKVVEHRVDLLNQSTAPEPETWEQYVGDVRQLLIGAARDPGDWHAGFHDAGNTLHHLRETGQLTRGLRAVLALHVIFHWNRIGLPGTTQATLAQAAKEAVFG